MVQMINHCSLASKDPELEQKYLYAHGYIKKQRIAKGDSKEQSRLLTELRNRTDYQEIRKILEELKNGNRN